MINDKEPLFDSKATMTGYVSADWKPVSLQGPWTQTLGWSEEELLATPFYKIIHPDDIQDSVSLRAKENQTPNFLTHENRLRCKNGTYKNILWHAFIDPSQTTTFLFARDITKLKIERFLAQRSQEVARIGSWALDYSDMQVYWTAQTYEIFGVHPSSFVPNIQNVFNFYSPEDAADLKLYYNNLPERARDTDREVKIYRPNGETCIIRLTARIFQKNGETIRLYGTAQDITAEKEITHRLVQVKEEAELATRIKSDFLANISHEIRTPMNSIIGMVELLSETALNDEQKRYSDVLSRASGNLLQILNDVLDLAKLEANQVKFENIAFNLRDVINRCAELFKHKALEKNLSLSVEINSKVPSVMFGDPNRIQQVLNNLLANAVKFTEKGDIQIHVFPNENPKFVAFEVTDTGSGIPAESIPHLFRRFYQVDSSISRRYGGTGLGLSISKEMIERMNGRIDVTSTEGQGSTFRFVLPVAAH